MPEQKDPSLVETVTMAMKQPKKWDKIIKAVDNSKVSKKAMSFLLKSVAFLIQQDAEAEKKIVDTAESMKIDF